jgi:hypothetical protein
MGINAVATAIARDFPKAPALLLAVPGASEAACATIDERANALTYALGIKNESCAQLLLKSPDLAVLSVSAPPERRAR